MITENQDPLQDTSMLPRDDDDQSTPRMSADDDDSDEDDDLELDEVDDELEEEDDEEGYDILPSNDAGITADDNAATGRMHEKEGE